MTHIEHYEANKAEFDLHIQERSKLQPSMDLLKPMIGPFKAEFPTVNLVSCHECIIDMIVWVRSEWKKTQDKPKKK